MAPAWTYLRTGVGKALTSLAFALVLAFLFAPAASGGVESKPWPPDDQPGKLFVHFGEEHVNDADGPTLLPKVVRESARYDPLLVTMSGDKADNGEREQFELWTEVMAAYDRREIPWFAGVGNHDRDSGPLPGGTNPLGAFDAYAEFFADRPYPMGDAPGYRGVRVQPRRRPAADPAGASSHYFADVGGVRWIFIDNSCYSIVVCNGLQHPSAQSPAGEAQLDFLRRVGREAQRDGRLTFAVMHMPTRDPGDQSYRDPIAIQHTMGKTALGILDNTSFELAAEQAGIDAVFVAHIKGQFIYRGEGAIPYFIDGGAGGELYTTGPVGTDHGYWHGFRLINARGDGFTTDAVPIFVRDGIRIEGPAKLQRGRAALFEAFGRQPVFNDPAKVPALELRDPDPAPPTGLGATVWIRDLVRWLAPLLTLPLALLAVRLASSRSRRRLLVPVTVAIGGLAVAGVSVAQQSEPTSTPAGALPNPARIWTSSDPAVLRPVASPTDDPRRHPRTQTADGRFRAICPGRARLTIASGFETASTRVEVPSEPGPIVRSVRPGAGVVERGRPATVARIGLDQYARVAVVLRRGGRTITRLHGGCERPGNLEIRWDGRGASRRGRYAVSVRILSDRKPVTRRYSLSVR